MLKIFVPDTCLNERAYIYETVFNTFWGIEYTVELKQNIKDRIEICYNDSRVSVQDVFFQQDCNWLKKESLPKQPLPIIDAEGYEWGNLLVSNKIPLIYGRRLEDGSYIHENKSGLSIGIDIFGSAFFMLTRYEEVVKQERDCYDRFSAMDSLAYQEGFLERPIINEYIEILWWAMKKLWPNLKRKKRKFELIPTHDVDRPFGTAFLSKYEKIRSLAGDLLKRRDCTLFFRRLKMMINIQRKGYQADEDNNFDYIMDISEKNGWVSRFYFMTLQGISPIDGNYDIGRTEIQQLMRKINNRGHKIGIHPSFLSYDNQDVFFQCVNLLREAQTNLGIDNTDLGGRQHYLRWRCPDTWRLYENAGLIYDATLTFADHIGFRCGVCYTYPVFDVVARKSLQLYEKPLIVMEGSGLDKIYMGLTTEEMLNRCLRLKEICRKYQGEFVILWHNSSLTTQEDRNLYKNIVEL